MATLWRKLTGGAREARDNDTTGISLVDWNRSFSPGAQVNWNGQTLQAFRLDGGNFSGAVKADSIVYAVEAKRVKVFSEARFQFRRLKNGTAGDLFGNTDLRILEVPWPGATTRDLLSVAEMDYAVRGNSYWVEADGHLVWLDPRHTKIVTEAWVDPVSGFRVGEQLLGYAYITERDQVTYYGAGDIAHFKPVPDPDNRFVGLSWIGQCLPDIDADQQLTTHKRAAVQNGAQLGYVVTLDATVPHDQFVKFVDKFREAHEGPVNAGKTVFLGGGADVKTVGQTFANLEIKATQGATETRIAACSGVSPVIASLSEGLAGSSLNAGNYGAAKRNFVDSEMRPAWGAFAGAFESIVTVPDGAQLWYDDRDIPFLREDVKDQAEILARNAQVARTLLDAGYEPDAVIEAIRANDLGRLTGNHSGLFSVQLQLPGSEFPTKPAPPTQKGAAA